jgi:hypothetical protein
MSVRKIVDRMKSSMRSANFQEAVHMLNELCSRKSEEYAVEEWNRLHMEIHPLWNMKGGY